MSLTQCSKRKLEIRLDDLRERVYVLLVFVKYGADNGCIAFGNVKGEQIIDDVGNVVVAGVMQSRIAGVLST